MQLTQASMEAHWDHQCPTTDSVNSERESTRSGGVSESTQVDQTTGMVSEGTAIRSDTEGALNGLRVRETVGSRNRAEHGEQTPGRHSFPTNGQGG